MTPMETPVDDTPADISMSDAPEDYLPEYTVTEATDGYVRGGYGYAPLPYDVEDIERYRPGGLHPLDIGDTLGDDGRYEVVAKLGHGGYSTVWLCWDHVLQKWKAVKVVASTASEDNRTEISILKHFEGVSDEELVRNHICLPRDNFFIEGPNGRHLCIVMPVFGESLHRAWKDYANWPDFLRRVCRQMTEAMKLMHDKSVCHGDFRPHNILFKLNDEFDKLPYEDMISMARGRPSVRVPPIPNTGEENSPHLPAHLYISTGLSPRKEFLSGDIMITDFGEAYHISQGRTPTGIPMCYSAPEAELKGYEKGFGTDIWALGVSIGEIRQGSVLFDEYSMVEYTQSLEELLGPLPEPYRSVWIERGYRPRGVHRPASEIPPTEPVSMTQKSLLSRLKENLEENGYATFLERVVRNKNGFLRTIQEGEILRENETDAGDGWKRIEYQTPPKEADQLVDLLTKIFKWNPAERLSASEVLAHPWLQVKDDVPVPDKDLILFARPEQTEMGSNPAVTDAEMEGTGLDRIQGAVPVGPVVPTPKSPENVCEVAILAEGAATPAPEQANDLFAWLVWVARGVLMRLYEGLLWCGGLPLSC